MIRRPTERLESFNINSRLGVLGGENVVIRGTGLVPWPGTAKSLTRQ
jgi:hypothetical protein